MAGAAQNIAIVVYFLTFNTIKCHVDSLHIQVPLFLPEILESVGARTGAEAFGKSNFNERSQTPALLSSALLGDLSDACEHTRFKISFSVELAHGD